MDGLWLSEGIGRMIKGDGHGLVAGEGLRVELRVCIAIVGTSPIGVIARVVGVTTVGSTSLGIGNLPTAHEPEERPAKLVDMDRTEAEGGRAYVILAGNRLVGAPEADLQGHVDLVAVIVGDLELLGLVVLVVDREVELFAPVGYDEGLGEVGEILLAVDDLVGGGVLDTDSTRVAVGVILVDDAGSDLEDVAIHRSIETTPAVGGREAVRPFLQVLAGDEAPGGVLATEAADIDGGAKDLEEVGFTIRRNVLKGVDISTRTGVNILPDRAGPLQPEVAFGEFGIDGATGLRSRDPLQSFEREAPVEQLALAVLVEIGEGRVELVLDPFGIIATLRGGELHFGTVRVGSKAGGVEVARKVGQVGERLGGEGLGIPVGET